ncbi:MAG: glycerol-3-phosphate 1-O-acyltransferase PlsB, partial [Steroidobacteraceae bacterium]|nr:glycerol-3-phosphate 1-O-acyltransferase PlsB [Steroidobacteraceae bacterium]
MAYLGLDRTVLWALRGLSRIFVRPTVFPEDARARLGGTAAPVLYVLGERSLSDFLAVEQACMQLGARRPSKKLVLGKLTLERSLVGLERRSGVLRRRPDRRVPPPLAAAVAAAVADPSLEFQVVPVAVYWGRAPQRERSWFNLALAENWALVGPFRRLLSILLNGRATIIRFGDPKPVRELLGTEADAVRAVRRLLRLMRAEHQHLRLDTIGPNLSPRGAIVAQVLRTRAVRQAARQLQREKNLTRREALRTARGFVIEIAADYSHPFVRLMFRLLTWLWTRLYDGVEVRNAEHLDRLPAGCEIVYTPCHRSHVDYLLLSYVIYARGYAIPYIAAGINLNLPVIGRYLRKGGAFFIRRSFRGASMYPIVFMKYVDVMLNRGHPIEFFIEGGRSRTGRLLEPKTGMLSMTMRSFLRDPRRPVVYVPVYFGYDRLVEARTYIGELSGRPKEKESIGGLLRALPALRQRFGRVQVSFGQPLVLGDTLERVRPGWRAEGYDDEARPSWFGEAVDAVADQIMVRINGAACATATNLLAFTLLATPRQAMLEGDLVRQLDLYRALLADVPYGPDVSVETLDGVAMIRHGETMGLLERRSHPLGDVLRMNEENSVLMTYYRNNVIQLFAMPSLVACAFLNNAQVRTEDIHRLAWRIYPYARQELFLRWGEDEVRAVVDQVLQALEKNRLLERTADDKVWRRPATGTVEAVQLSVLAQGTVQMIERYYLAIAILLKAGPDALTPDGLEQRCVTMAQRMALLYGLAAPEFFDKAMFRAFIDLLRRRGVVTTAAGGRLAYG